MKKVLNNKLIGFTISKKEIDHTDIDIFGSNLSIKKINHNNLFIYLWGVGDINKCKIDSKYSLSFPLNASLLDRNILISFEDENIVIENDWLGSIPVFYNPNELIVSTLSRKTLNDKTIHPEGLNSYFEFGYSVFGQTPFNDVNFMRYFSKLVISANELNLIYKDDPILEKELFEHVEDENDVLNKIKSYVANVENHTTGEILLPTSGGYDSRLLNICVNDKHRIRSYTYGLSSDQSKSYEVVYAKKMSEILGTEWKQIELGHYHQHINDWYNIYGFSTHLHGMYHIEFYKKILEQDIFSNDVTFLSGIIGDAWSGNVNIPKIEGFTELFKLSYSHGMNLDKKNIEMVAKKNIGKEFFEENKNFLDNKKTRIIQSMRFKIILLSYLTQIPEYFGFPVWTPFLNFDIAISMLNIQESRKKNRVWQKEFFIKNGLDLEPMKLNRNISNTLDYDAFDNFDFEPIDVGLMKEYIKEEYLFRINQKLSNKAVVIDDVINKLMSIRYIGGLIGLIGIKNDALDKLYSYCIIKSIEMGLKGEKQ